MGLVGNGTVSVVDVITVARACASTTPFRVKFAIGSPKPRFANPMPVTVNVAGGVARSIVFGAIAVTPGAGRESVTVRGPLPCRS